jgi:hypothetical protein
MDRALMQWRLGLGEFKKVKGALQSLARASGARTLTWLVLALNLLVLASLSHVSLAYLLAWIHILILAIVLCVVSRASFYHVGAASC